MFIKKTYAPTEGIWLRYAFIDCRTSVKIRWGIRYAHIYSNGKKIGKILKSEAKQKFVET